MRELSDGEPEDFILLELRNGYPLLRLNHGSGETKVSVDGRDRQGHVRLGKLNDGFWHRVDIFRNGKVTLSSILHSYLNAGDVQKFIIKFVYFQICFETRTESATGRRSVRDDVSCRGRSRTVIR